MKTHVLALVFVLYTFLEVPTFRPKNALYILTFGYRSCTKCRHNLDIQSQLFRQNLDILDNFGTFCSELGQACVKTSMHFCITPSGCYCTFRFRLYYALYFFGGVLYPLYVFFLYLQPKVAHMFQPVSYAVSRCDVALQWMVLMCTHRSKTRTRGIKVPRSQLPRASLDIENCFFFLLKNGI